MYLEGLRDHPELLVRQDDAIPVVVLDIDKDALAVLLGEIILAGVEYPCIRIGLAEGVAISKTLALSPMIMAYLPVRVASSHRPRYT